MNLKLNRFELGSHLLRLGLSAVFLWFGFSQLFDSVRWVSIVPNWAVDFLNIPPAFIVLGNGAFEVVLGSLLAMGIWTRLISLVLGLHLIPIMFDLGLTAVGVRDFGLVISSLTLALIGSNKFSEKSAPTQTYPNTSSISDLSN